MSDYNPGDILTISTTSYKGRRFEVVEANGHRTVLRGAKGARRVLVETESSTPQLDAALGATVWHLFEDDGEKNRGRPCSVDDVEQARVDGPLAAVKCNPMLPRERQIRRECRSIADMLCAKNRDYGDSALSPLRIFSKADPALAIRVRIDDKLSRLARGNDAGEDTVKDLVGYLILLRIAEGSHGMTDGEDG